MQKRNHAAMIQLKTLLIMAAAVLAATVSACSTKSAPPGPDAAGGVYQQAGYSFMRWKEGLVLMIWHDAPGSSMSDGSGSTTDPVYKLHGYAESRDGRRVDWQVETTDGETAQFWIDDTNYDLSDGAIFIITRETGETKVRQLHGDLSGVQPHSESVAAFAESDPDLTEFLGGTSDPH